MFIEYCGCPAANIMECEEWTAWSACPASCGGAEEKQTKSCRLVDSTGAVLEENIVRENVRPCAADPCPIVREWSLEEAF